jgi:hypothetical protein
VTEETILVITDFADNGQVEDAKKLWRVQINQMKVETGG